MSTKKEDLMLSIDEAEWGWLKSHLVRGGLILVEDDLDLADAAMKVSGDDADAIEQWILSGRISKPSEAQIHKWDEDQHKKFSMLIVSPFVLIQEKTPIFH
ncbi:MAG: DUF2288 domain-containing protein [Geobacter sp.]|nr:MAG: DUF2288 domain-containing protein [Geobacter sp.]